MDAVLFASDVYLGILFIASLLLALALVAPLSPLTMGVCVAGGLAAAAGAIRRGNRPPVPFYYCCLGLWVVAAFVAPREVTLYDTGLYHQQAATWLSRHGLVRGLALLHFRLGFASSWFALSAPLNSGYLAGREAALIGGVVPALLVAGSIVAMRNLKNGVQRLSNLTWICVSGCFLSVAFVWHLDSSLSPDLVIWLLPLTAAAMLSDETEPLENRLFRAGLVSALGCLVKPTALPTLLYVAAVAILNPATFKTVLARIRMIGAIAVPLALGAFVNLRLSGCPAFPASVFCRDDPSSVGPENAVYVRGLITSFVADRNLLWAETAPMIAISIICCVIALRLKRDEALVRHGIHVSLAGIIAVTAQAPNARFAMGYLLTPIAISMAVLLAELLQRFDPGHMKPLAQARIAILTGAAVVTALGLAAADSSFFYPIKMPASDGDRVPIVNRTRNESATFSVRIDSSLPFFALKPLHSDQCWDAAIPCTPGVIVRSIRSRSPDGAVSEGFTSEEHLTGIQEDRY